MGRSCYHMLDVRERPADPDAWGDAYEGRPPSWEEFFGGYGATVDWPAAPFWPETGTAFPDALVPLSVREATRGGRACHAPSLWRWLPTSRTMHLTTDGPGWDEAMMTSFSPAWQDEASAKAAYLAHNELVRTTAPKDRLLEWHPEEGWEPICAGFTSTARTSRFRTPTRPHKPFVTWAWAPSRRCLAAGLEPQCAMEIRRALPSEAGSLAALWLRSRAASVPSIPPTVHTDVEVHRWFEEVVLPTREVWVADGPCGAIALMVLDNEWIDQLYVDPAFDTKGHRRGTARSCHEAASDRTQALDLSEQSRRPALL